MKKHTEHICDGHCHEEHCHEEHCHEEHCHEEHCHEEHCHEEHCHDEHCHEEHCHDEHCHEEHCHCCCGNEEHTRSHSHSHSHSGGCACGCGHEHVSEGQSVRVQLLRIGVSVLLIAGAFLLEHFSLSVLSLLLWLAAFAVAGYDIVFSAMKNLFRGHILDENFLMSIAAAGAFVLGEYFEALAVVILYRIGEMFEGYASDRSRRSIEALGELCPDTACVLRDGEETVVPADEVRVGETVSVLAGGRIPFDGVVLDGASALDTSALTGESLPREIKAGDEVWGGCINLTSRILLEVSKPASESAASRILALIEGASERRSKQESFIRSFAKVYTPCVVGFAVLLTVILPLFLGSFEESLYRALSFLVVSCPCALVVSVPLSIFCGIGRASREGILIKGGIAMDQLARVEIAAFDKTGTLTEGRFSVRKVSVSSGSEEELLALAAGMETASTHPIARSVVEYAKSVSVDPVCTEDVRTLVGRGLCATVDGKESLLGNAELMRERGIAIPDGLNDQDENRIFCALDGKLIGSISVADAPKESAKDTLKQMKTLGVRSCVILTGDAKGPALRVAEAVGADEVRYGLMPEDKVAAIEEKKQGAKGSLLFVGDGINDSPSLACADVGVAMGGLGSDAAISAADAVILDDDIGKVVRSIGIAKKTMRIAKQNIVFSIAIKFTILVLSAIGLVGMDIAILGDVGVLVLATLNSLRATK